MPRRKGQRNPRASSRNFRIQPIRPDELDPEALARAFAAAAITIAARHAKANEPAEDAQGDDAHGQT